MSLEWRLWVLWALWSWWQVSLWKALSGFDDDGE